MAGWRSSGVAGYQSGKGLDKDRGMDDGGGVENVEYRKVGMLPARRFARRGTVVVRGRREVVLPVSTLELMKRLPQGGSRG